MFEVCTLSDSRACASASDVCSNAAHCVRKSVYCESLECETDFLLGGQVCTRRELSDLLSKLPWAARHVFDRNESKRNDARAIVDALYLRTLHDEYSVSKSEEIYVVRSILDAALLADYRDQYRGVDRGIIGHIEAAYNDVEARVRKFWSELGSESQYVLCDHYDAWCFKHPECAELWYACDDAYDIYGHDDDEHNKALEVLVRFGLIDNVSDLPDRGTLLRRARVYLDTTYTACGGGRCLASRDRRECRSNVNKCAYSACNSAAYHAACVRMIIDCAIRSFLGLWINVDCDTKAVDHNARRYVLNSPVSPTWCGCSLMLRKPHAELRLGECEHHHTWLQHNKWLRNVCERFDTSTCQTPAEGRKERARERRNARRREARYVLKLKASVYRGERSIEAMLAAYENLWNALQRYYLYAEKRWQSNPIDRLRARAVRACATLVAVGESIMAIHANLRKIGYPSLDQVC